MSQEVLMALIGIVSSSFSSLLTFLFTKKKYSAEVDGQVIQNQRDEIAKLKEMLEVYNLEVNNNKKMMKEYMDRVEESMLEIHKLRAAVQELLATSCVVPVCKKRKLVDVKKAEQLIGISDEV